MTQLLVQVTKDEFYSAVGPLDVVVRIVPTGSDFEMRNRQLVGRTIGNQGHYWDADRTYYLVKRMPNA